MNIYDIHNEVWFERIWFETDFMAKLWMDFYTTDLIDNYFNNNYWDYDDWNFNYGDWIFNYDEWDFHNDNPNKIKYPEIVNNFTEIELKNVNETCSICIHNFETHTKCIILPCKHFFHKECISKWLEENNSCPVCRCTLY